MGSQRSRIRMTDDEVAEFLTTERTLQVASIGPDGAPHLVTMWFKVIDGRIAMWTYGQSQKAANLRRDPRVVCLAEAGDTYGELRGVSVTGRAELHEDYDAVLAVGLEIYGRYQPAMNEAGRAGVEAQAHKRVAVFVIPDKTVSWDHRKL